MPGRIIVHDSEVGDWPGCLRATSRLIEQHQLDTEQATWRLHVFLGVHGVPASAGQPSTVIVVQISHALADGLRSSALAGFLFGRSQALPVITALPVHFPFARSVAAVRARRQLVRETAAGLVPPRRGPYLRSASTTRRPVRLSYVPSFGIAPSCPESRRQLGRSSRFPRRYPAICASAARTRRCLPRSCRWPMPV